MWSHLRIVLHQIILKNYFHTDLGQQHLYHRRDKIPDKYVNLQYCKKYFVFSDFINIRVIDQYSPCEVFPHWTQVCSVSWLVAHNTGAGSCSFCWIRGGHVSHPDPPCYSVQQTLISRRLLWLVNIGKLSIINTGTQHREVSVVLQERPQFPDIQYQIMIFNIGHLHQFSNTQYPTTFPPTTQKNKIHITKLTTQDTLLLCIKN